ncbi:hypothetical protein V1318_02440 [Lysobacter sp. CCNWLW3]|uniref:DUF7710 domain-containing protein n=1 Tax=unclassified Lysobacter TaxID=2635362 RepID=UPI002FD559ED
MTHVWIFNGYGAQFPAAVFSSRDLADSWIRQNALSGTLTQYPVDVSVLDWSIQQGSFRPTKPNHATAQFKQSFTSAAQPHDHYTDGRTDA